MMTKIRQTRWFKFLVVRVLITFIFTSTFQGISFADMQLSRNSDTLALNDELHGPKTNAVVARFIKETVRTIRSMKGQNDTDSDILLVLRPWLERMDAKIEVVEGSFRVTMTNAQGARGSFLISYEGRIEADREDFDYDSNEVALDPQLAAAEHIGIDRLDEKLQTKGLQDRVLMAMDDIANELGKVSPELKKRVLELRTRRIKGQTEEGVGFERTFLNFVEGIEGFDGHAGKAGIHIDIEYLREGFKDEEDRTLRDILQHEILAYLFPYKHGVINDIQGRLNRWSRQEGYSRTGLIFPLLYSDLRPGRVKPVEKRTEKDTRDWTRKTPVKQRAKKAVKNSVKTVSSGVLAFEDISPDPRQWSEKGSRLAMMKQAGLPVPDGFVIAADGVASLGRKPEVTSSKIWPEIVEEIAVLEQKTGRSFGKAGKPLVIAVRPGAEKVLPGLMPTVMIGLNDETVKDLAREVGGMAAYDAYARSLLGYGLDILGIEPESFPARPKKELSLSELKSLIKKYKEVIGSEDDIQNPWKQLERVLSAIPNFLGKGDVQDFAKSWAPGLKGIAVTIQNTVFGNIPGKEAGSGYMCTRNPQTGEGLSGWFLEGVMGEDLMTKGVPYTKTRRKFDALRTKRSEKIEDIKARLESLFGWAQTAEFVVDHEGRFWVVQANDTACGPQTKLTILNNMLMEGTLTKKEYSRRLVGIPVKCNRMWERGFDSVAEGEPIGEDVVYGEVVYVDNTKQMSKDLSEKQDVIAVVKELDDYVADALLKGKIKGLVITGSKIALHRETMLRIFGIPAIIGAKVNRRVDTQFAALKVDRHNGNLYELDEDFCEDLNKGEERVEQAEIYDKRLAQEALRDSGMVLVRKRGVESVGEVQLFRYFDYDKGIAHIGWDHWSDELVYLGSRSIYPSELYEAVPCVASPHLLGVVTDYFEYASELADNSGQSETIVRHGMSLLAEAGLVNSISEKEEDLIVPGKSLRWPKYRKSKKLPDNTRRLALAYMDDLFDESNPKNKGHARKYWFGEGEKDLVTVLKDNFTTKKMMSEQEIKAIYKADAEITGGMLNEHCMISPSLHYKISVNRAKIDSADMKLIVESIRQNFPGVNIDPVVEMEDHGSDAPTFVFQCLEGKKEVGKTALNLQHVPESENRTVAIFNLGLAASRIPKRIPEGSKGLYRPVIKYINEQYKLLNLLGVELIDYENAKPGEIAKILRNINIILPPIKRDFKRKIEMQLQDRIFEKFA